MFYARDIFWLISFLLRYFIKHIHVGQAMLWLNSSLLSYQDKGAGHSRREAHGG